MQHVSTTERFFIATAIDDFGVLGFSALTSALDPKTTNAKRRTGFNGFARMVKLAGLASDNVEITHVGLRVNAGGRLELFVEGFPKLSKPKGKLRSELEVPHYQEAK